MNGNLWYEAARQRVADKQRDARQASEARQARAAARARRASDRAQESPVTPAIPDYPHEMFAEMPRQEAAHGRRSQSSR